MNSVENKYVKIPRKTPFITILLVDGIVERLKITWQTQYIRTKLLSKILLINLVWWNAVNKIKCKGNCYGHTSINNCHGLTYLCFYHSFFFWLLFVSHLDHFSKIRKVNLLAVQKNMTSLYTFLCFLTFCILQLLFRLLILTNIYVDYFWQAFPFFIKAHIFSCNNISLLFQNLNFQDNYLTNFK